MEEIRLSDTVLFEGVSEKEAREMVNCLQAVRKRYEKQEMIYRMGEHAEALGMVLSGSVWVARDDIWGNRTILEHIGPGQVFAEVYACTPKEPLMIHVAAAQTCEILFLSVEKILTLCPASCSFHSRLVRNLLSVTAQKNLSLTRKIFHTSPKTIRGRLCSYLSFEAVRQGSRTFDIPFNRQELADYLGVDRSAMSHELGKMSKEGLVFVERNRFHLKEAFRELGS